MKLENQVISLEISKKLKLLNVKQESLFYWIEDYEEYSNYPEILYAPTSEVVNNLGELDWPRNNPENCHSAFTPSELLEILPETIIMNDYLFFLSELLEQMITILLDISMIVIKTVHYYRKNILQQI